MPPRRLDPDDNSIRRSDPDDFATVRGLSAGRKVFGRYVLEMELGVGGMGVVWRARDAELDEPVALKFLPEVVARDDAAVAELMAETRHARRLTHPNIVRIHQFEREGAMAAVSMEFVDGMTLTNLRLAQPGEVFAVETLAPFVAQLCAALDYAHGQAKIVHRDLKPANILVTRDRVVKVADFGIARSLSDTHTRLTEREGDTSGTLVYMSPQQLSGEDPAASDDIYALGATLYELLTGKPPFHTGDVAWQIRETAPKPVKERLASLGLAPVPAEWADTIQACLAKEPQDRPRAAGEVARRLGIGGVEGKGQGAKVVGELELQGTRAKHRIALLIGFAALGLGLLAYTFWPLSPEKLELVSLPNEVPAVPSALAPAAVAPVETLKPPTPTALPREFTVTVDPPDAGARLWLGPLSDIEVKDGKGLLKDLPDGEHELTVQAPNYQTFTTRVTVKEGRGSVEAKLVPVRGAVTITARPGTQVTAIDEHAQETRLGTVPPDGVFDVANLLTVGRYTLRLEHADCVAMTVPGVELLLGRTVKVAPAQTPLPGELRVFSVPTGAEVRVNGTVAGSTPATVKNQPSEQALRVEVFQHGYRRMEESVTLKPQEVRTVNFGTLVAESGSIEFRTSSSDYRFELAQIAVDGKPIQVARVGPNAPFALDGLEVGSRTVEITLPDNEPWRQTVTVRDQQTTAVNVELKSKPGMVACETTPAGARVVINGGGQHETLFIESRTNAEYLTPLRGVLPPGTYTLRFELKGYMAATRTATVAANRTSEVSATLEKFRGADEGQAWTVPDLNLEMVYIRPGMFTMGSPDSEEGRWDDESPQTRVTLTKGYWLGKTEVTQGQYESLMGNNPSNFKGSGRDLPVERVSWEDAMQFCRKLTEREHQAGRLSEGYEYTLPTEAQWEYACRAGTTGGYAGNLDSMAWYKENSGNTTHPVAQKQPNAWGLYDMHGNLWEWCRDWYADRHSGGSVRDPTGPSSGSLRVNRGGGLDSVAVACRSAFCGRGAPGDRGYNMGFRLALAPTMGTEAPQGTQ